MSASRWRLPRVPGDGIKPVSMPTILVGRLDPAAILLGIFVRVLVVTEAQGVGPQLPPGLARERPAAHRDVPWEVGDVT
ncbi:MAG: hypothetical protein KGY78_08450 [Anaerolineae bacterium]|nr:hypothetical protein [Anaerolineae bacterium]